MELKLGAAAGRSSRETVSAGDVTTANSISPRVSFAATTTSRPPQDGSSEIAPMANVDINAATFGTWRRDWGDQFHPFDIPAET
jgi:hypothetical protein